MGKLNKYLLCIPHSILFSWVCRFGGALSSGDIYLLWPARIGKHADITLSNLNITTMYKSDCIFKGTPPDEWPEGLKLLFTP